MSTEPKIISIRGRGLKLDTSADIEPFLTVDPSTVEEIHLSGNTIGVDASEALAKFLSKATSLKVRLLFYALMFLMNFVCTRLLTSQISSPED